MSAYVKMYDHSEKCFLTLLFRELTENCFTEMQDNSIFRADEEPEIGKLDGSYIYTGTLNKLVVRKKRL